MLFAFLKRAGYGAAAEALADEAFVVSLISGNTVQLCAVFEIAGISAPAKKVAMLAFIRGDATKGNPIKGDYAPAWGLFLGACAQALELSERTLADAFEADLTAAVRSTKTARAASKAIKVATTAPTTAPVAAPTTAPVAAPTTAPVAAPTTAPVAAPIDPLDQAISLIEAAIAANTLKPPQQRRLERAMALLAIPA